MTSRRAVVAAAVLIPVLLGLSAVGYASMTATVNPSDNGNSGFYGGPRCTTTVQLPEVAGGVIQTAINAAAPGAVICVAPGVYPEQLSITKPLTLVGLGNAHNPSEIQPTSVVSNSVDPDTGAAEYNIILVGGGSSTIPGVTISNLVVDGSLSGSSITACGNSAGTYGYNGALYLNAGGTITGTTVQNILLAPGLAGCQPGNAIEVQTASGQSSSVTISNDQALNYNKNGITCNDAGSTCIITQNTVSFYAPYAQYIAPNGIQVGFGAVGMVTGNTVSGNECDVGFTGTPPAPTPTSVCGPNYVTQTQSAGILTYQSGKGTTVSGNTVTGNDIGILTSTDAVTVTNNLVQNNRFEGMYLNDGTYTASNNQISCSRSASCDIGVAIVSDGYADNPTTVNLDNNFNNNNNFNGAFTCSPAVFTCAPLQIVAYNGAPCTTAPIPPATPPACTLSGPYVEPATLTINGFTETVTSGTLASSNTPSFVDLTNFPNSGPFFP